MNERPNILMLSRLYRREVKNDVWKYLQNISFVRLFVCLFVIINPENLYRDFASRPGLEGKPWEYIHSGRVALPAVLPKVHHRPEPLYVPTDVNTLQVDGFASLDLRKPHTDTSSAAKWRPEISHVGSP